MIKIILATNLANIKAGISEYYLVMMTEKQIKAKALVAPLPHR